MIFFTLKKIYKNIKINNQDTEKNSSILFKLLRETSLLKKKGSVKEFLNSFFNLQWHLQSIVFWLILELCIFSEIIISIVSYSYLNKISNYSNFYGKISKELAEDSKYYN